MSTQLAAIPVIQQGSVDSDRANQDFRSVHALCDYLELEPAQLAPWTDPNSAFAIRVPFEYARKIQKGDPSDPLLIQVLPQHQERTSPPGYSPDPLREQDFSPLPGVIHKYDNRVLLVATQACAIHCRYCFRQHFPYTDHRLVNDKLDDAIGYIEQNSKIDEVILSGGDPFSLSSDKLVGLLQILDAIPHVRRLRVHSRTLLHQSNRINKALMAGLTQLRTPIVFVVHCNHPNELDAGTAKITAQLGAAGVHLLNQSVLLAGVNATVPILRDLSLKLFDQRILPYYLNRLDPVSGASHFAIDDEQARALIIELLNHLPGYLMPRYITDQPGFGSKLPIDLKLFD